MNILIVCGSPHRDGTTNALAEAFLSGVDQSRHTVEKAHIPKMNIHPCLGCDCCKTRDGKCVQRDDMDGLYPALLKADLVVFASGLYYFGFTAQMKAFIDRFYAVNARLRAQTGKKAILLTAGGGSEEWIMDGILANYHTMLRYLNWESLGTVCAYGCHVKAHLENTACLEEARKLGERL